jgi:hypothetical protein
VDVRAAPFCARGPWRAALFFRYYAGGTARKDARCHARFNVKDTTPAAAEDPAKLARFLAKIDAEDKIEPND